jgi:PAS domain S-box-containing protein
MEKSLRILILEDNPADAELIQSELEEVGCIFTSKVVMTEEDYVCELQESSPDLILSDYDLPKYTGALALAEAKERCPETPFILVTGVVTEDRAIDILTMGAKDYVLKTRLHQRLVPAVKRALAEAEEHKARKRAEEELRKAHAELELKVMERTAALEAEVAIRKETGEELRAREAEFQLVAEATPVLLTRISRDLRYVFVNQACANWLGRSAEEIIGKSIVEILGQEAFETIRPYFERVLQGERVEYEVQIPYKGRGHQFMQVTYVPEKNRQGEVVGWLASILDITERKQAEERNEKERRRLEAVLENIPVAVVIVEASDGRLSFINGRARELYGFDSSNLAMKEHLETVKPKKTDGSVYPFHELPVTLALKGQTVLSKELMLERPDGTSYHINGSASPVFDSEGRVTAAVVIFEDITERKQAEEAVAIAQMQLQSIMDNTPGLVYAFDLQERFIQANKAVADLLMVPLDRMIGRRRHEFMAGHIADRDEANDRQVIEKGAPLQFDEPGEFRGKLITYLTTKFPLRDTNGMIYGIAGVSFDITERKQADEALAVAHNQLQSIIDNTTAIIYAFDLEGRFVMANTVVAELLNSTPEKMIGKRRHEFMPKDDADWHEANDRQVIEAGRALEFEEHSQFQDRSITWLTTKFPLSDAQGRIYAVAGISADITDRKRAEKALQESEEKYRKLFMNMTEEVHFWKLVRDEKGQIKTWQVEDINPPTVKAWGRESREDTIGRTADEIYPRATEHFMPIVQKIMAEGIPYSYEDYFPPPVDKYFRFTNIPLGEYFFTTGADITDIKKAELALRESEGRLRLAQQAARVGTFDWNLQNDRNVWTPELEALYGLQPGEFAQTGTAWAELIHPEDQTNALKVAHESILTGELTTGEWRVVWPDGSVHWLAGQWQVFKDGSGQPLRMTGVILDITERKHTEEELKGKSRQLEDANKELESFSYSVSHDLKAPLRAIDSYSRMLLKKDADKLSEDTIRKLDVIRSNAEKMNSLIDDLLSFSKVLKSNMAISEIKMDKLVREVWAEIQAANTERELELRIKDMLPGNGDPILLRQVIFNLISNAVKFTNTRKPGIIEVSCCSEDGNVVYCIKDNGVGFDMTYYGKLFGVFQRLHGDEEYEGTGVGLAIVHRIINKHGGRVWAEGEVDKGATFYFTLPTA